jgi:transposase
MEAANHLAPPTWFDKNLSDRLPKPLNPEYCSLDINKYARIDRHFFPKNNVSFDLPKETELTNSKTQSLEDSFRKYTENYNKKLALCTTDQEREKLQTQFKTQTTKYQKKVNHQNDNIKALSVGLPVTIQQHRLFQEKMKECLRVYNYCVQLANNKENPVSINILSSREKLRDLVLPVLYPNGSIECYDTLDDEIRSFCSNVKSCLTNLKEGHIKYFEMKPRILKSIQSIYIGHKAITEKGIYLKRLGKLPTWDKLYHSILKKVSKIECDCRLVYDSLTSRYTLKIPYYTRQIQVSNRNQVVALDPGEKVFMTYYSPQECGRIGNDIRVPLLKEETRIRKLQRILAKGKNKEGKHLKHKKAIKKKIQTVYRRIQNKVKELHNQAAHYLTDHFNEIWIPPFETKRMVRNERLEIKENKKKYKSLKEKGQVRRRWRLNGRVKFVLLQLSHYKFRQHLEKKCLEKGCQMKIVDESYTSMCCGGCGRKGDEYDNRIKKCICGTRMDRDLNGSRNIMLKTIIENKIKASK